jgi:KDO2-lipid IV(A) lauroyltransferase
MATDSGGVGRRLQYGAEYAAVRILSSLVGLLPERLAVWTGVALGRFLWLIAPRRRRIARDNLRRAMPDARSGPELRRLVREVFVHIGLTAVETLWMRRRVTRRTIEQRFPVEGIGELRSALAAGRGVIAFTPHLGNWELFGACMAVRLGQLNALARPVNNPGVRRYTTRLRRQFGIEVLSTRKGVRPMIRALRRGETLAVLIDQHVNRAFVPATFFGRPAATTAVVAALALRLDAPVVASYSVRQGHSFRHRGQIEGPIELVRTGDREADVLANTQRFNDLLEQAVRRHPEQWLWTHRRWKLADRTEQETQKEPRDHAA